MDLNQTMRVMEDFARIQDDMQLSTLRTLLFIASMGKCYQADVENYLGLSRAAVSRNVAYWTDIKFDGRKGIGFITREEDPNDRRNNILVLTPRGKLFLERMRERHGSQKGQPMASRHAN